MTFLRFTRSDYRAIVRACRPLELCDDFFPAFRAFLAEALAGTSPTLAARINALQTYQVGIIYEYLRERREANGRDAGGRLTSAEYRAVLEACRTLVLQPRFRSSLRQILAHHFRRSWPGLARKLGTFTDRQIERLYVRVQEGRERGA